MNKAKIFLQVAWFFIGGILIAGLFNFNDIGLTSLGLVILLIVAFIFKKQRRLIFYAFAFLLGIWRLAIATPIADVRTIQYYNGQNITTSGYICAEPDVRSAQQKITLCVVGGKILVTTNLYPLYEYGDELSLQGKIMAPTQIDNFAYDLYLARFGIYSLSYSPQLKKIGEVQALSAHFYRGLFAFKNQLKNVVDQSLKEPEAGLANALILGCQRTVNDFYLNEFSIIGLSHMIAISGTHITLLSAIIFNCFLFIGLGRRRAFYLSLIFLTTYVLITGWQASAVRSLIMGALVLYAQYLGRVAKMENGLILAAAVMLLGNPKSLRDDLGFQLSFMAILALLYIYPLFDAYTEKILARMNLKEFWAARLKAIFGIFNVTMACQILSWPLIAIGFNRASLIAPVANLIILWVFDILMIMLLAALAAAWFLPFLAAVLFLPSYWLLKYIYFMTDILAQCPGAAIGVNNFNWWEAGIYYLVLGLIIWKLHRRREVK